MSDDLSKVQALADELAAHGIVVTFCFGLCGKCQDPIWSVDVLTQDGRSFDRPYGAHTLTQAAEIARQECEQRGWLTPDR